MNTIRDEIIDSVFDNLLSEEQIIKFVNDKYGPEDIFNYKQLSDWANGNGFIRAENE